MSIKRKLLMIALVTAGLSIIIISLLFGYMNFNTAKNNRIANTQTITKLIDENVRGALAFGDLDRVKEVLASLKTTPAVMQACLFDDLDHFVAAYNPDAAEQCTDLKVYGVTVHGTEYILVGQRVEQNGAFLGSVFVQSNLRSLMDYFKRQILLSLVGICIVFWIVSYPIAIYLQKSLSQSIYDLAVTSRRLPLPAGSSLVPAHGNDEIQMIQNILAEIHPYLEDVAQNTVSKSKYNAVLTNKYLSFRYALHFASVMNLSSLTTKKFIEQGQYGKISDEYLELLDININVSQDLKKNIAVLQELLEQEAAILKEDREFIDLSDLITKVYDEMFLKDHSAITIKFTDFNLPLWPVYYTAFRKVIENLFMIFDLLENDNQSYAVAISAQELSLKSEQAAAILTFHLSRKESKAGQEELAFRDLPHVYQLMFKCKFFQNIIHPNMRSALSFDITKDSITTTIMLPLINPSKLLP